MLAVTLLVTFGAAECACICLTPGRGRAVATAAHAALLTAMLAMLIAPQHVSEIAAGVLAILLLVAIDRLRRRTPLDRYDAHLIACAVGALALLKAMATAPSAAMPGMSAAMPGMSAAMPGMSAAMPGMGQRSGPDPVRMLAWIVLVVFLAHALVEGALVLRRSGPTSFGAPHRIATIFGSLSMVVMCAAMTGGV